MWDTCAIDLKVELPRTVAAELAEVQLRDPELLGRMLMYAVARRRIFERMCTGTLAEGDAAATSA